MQYVQIVLTTDQVGELRNALTTVAVDPEEEPERVALLQQLEHFLEQVALNAAAFPVTGAMARAIRSRMRKLKGPAQPQSRRNKHKARQEKRMRTTKARRQERREAVEAYNAARERAEADMQEIMEVAQERQRRREVLASREALSVDEVAELFELFDLPHVSKWLRDENALTPQERIDRAKEAA